MMVSLQLTSEEREQLMSLLALQRGTSATPPSLNELLGQWTAFVRTVERGYDDSIYEYTNDLAVRDLLEDLLLESSSSLRVKLEAAIAPIDKRFVSATEPAATPLRTTKGELATWWVRVPTRRIGELADDLESMGHIE